MRLNDYAKLSFRAKRGICFSAASSAGQFFSRERRSPDRLRPSSTNARAESKTFNVGAPLQRALFAVALLAIAIAAAPSANAEYFVLKSGQRLVVTGYQLVGDTYKLQLSGGSAELAAAEVVAIEPEEVFRSTPKPALADIPYANFISSASRQHGVDADLIVSVITVESKFNPKAVSRKNARGLMQLLPETATRLGVKNIFDPQENINAGTKYLRELLDRYDNDLTLTIAAYNAGPQRIDQFKKNVPPYRETISYVRLVQKTYKARKSGQSSSLPGAQNKSAATPALALNKTAGGL